MKKILGAVVFLGLTSTLALSQRDLSGRLPSNEAEPVLELGKEYIPANEEEEFKKHIAKITDLQDKFMASFAKELEIKYSKKLKELNERSKADPSAKAEISKLEAEIADAKKVRRGFHAKSHGCMTGKLKVLADRPAESRHGIFSDKAPSVYDVWVRFSNATGRMQSDAEKDPRGLAIKVLGVEGEKLLPGEESAKTQDFLMTNKPRGTTKDAKSFMEFGEAVAKGKGAIALFFLTHPREAKELLSRIGRRIPSMANEQYWSGIAFRLGEKAIKFNVLPCQQADQNELEAKMPKDLSPNYLREELVERVTRRGESLCFNFYVQFQSDPVATPIEDGFNEWTEEEAPSVRIARLEIPAQKFDTPAQNEYCEKLSFTPWHALKEHQPLGNMNRARKVVYLESRNNRDRGGPNVEPVKIEKFN